MRWKESIGVRLTHEKDYVMKTSYLIEKVNVVNSILKPSSNRSPFIFYASSDSKNRSYKIHASINRQRHCTDTTNYFI